MATRQDSGSNAAHENQRPSSHNEDAIPEMSENEASDRTRGMAEDEDDEFEITVDLDEESEETDDSDI